MGNITKSIDTVYFNGIKQIKMKCFGRFASQEREFLRRWLSFSSTGPLMPKKPFDTLLWYIDGKTDLHEEG